MTTWMPIESAPRDGSVIRLRSDAFPALEPQSMHWNARRKQWEGRAFAAMGSVATCWDKTESQPTHWQPVTAGA